ncbi:tRNA (N6-threonylcarbamoyladenosine(37)-N6)-methyltransferase TrmO [Pseudonocardia benzenivorans]|uniref:tRNA (N6-threonylcarbamoyladenosine(37)-N6)-methyltransferase TrmO n=1 Tax=Pseudonocardia benzenivorans TaxID=228005 RepID=A0ABW3VJ02_9PSEU|nr:tRNA (N6-threonylcarbamoyladenosine(37)-N6)-methyltransferase TrmO [Pseudonocardia sp. D17]
MAPDATPPDSTTGRPALVAVGHVSSPLTDTDAAPKQGDEGGPQAWVVLDDRYREAARDLAAGAEVLLLTWLHRADRATLVVHPRDDPEAPLRGVFATRSADRPNPIGVHRVTITAVEPGRFRVRDLEAVDGTPVLDVKPVLTGER